MSKEKLNKSEMAKLRGISVDTLRYYDKIDLFKLQITLLQISQTRPAMKSRFLLHRWCDSHNSTYIKSKGTHISEPRIAIRKSKKAVRILAWRQLLVVPCRSVVH